MLKLSDEKNLILEYFYHRLKDYRIYEYEFVEIWKHTNLDFDEFNLSLDKLFKLELLYYDNYLCKITDKGIKYVEQQKQDVTIEISTN